MVKFGHYALLFTFHVQCPLAHCIMHRFVLGLPALAVRVNWEGQPTGGVPAPTCRCQMTHANTCCGDVMPLLLHSFSNEHVKESFLALSLGRNRTCCDKLTVHLLAPICCHAER